MKKIILLLFTFLSFNCFSQVPKVFSDVKADANYANKMVDTEDGRYFIGNIPQRGDGDTLIIAKLSYDKKVVFIRKIKFSGDLYIHDLIVNKNKIIAICQTRIHTPNPPYKSGGLIVAWDTSGKYLWHQETDYSPISGIFVEDEKFILVYTNYVKNVHKYFLGFSVVDKIGQIKNSKNTDYPIWGASDVFLRFNKEKGTLETLFSVIESIVNRVSDVTIYKIKIDTSLNVVDELYCKSNYTVSNWVTNTNYITGRLQKRGTLLSTFMMDSLNFEAHKVNSISSVLINGITTFISEKYVFVEEMGELSIYEIDNARQFILTNKLTNIDNYRFIKHLVKSDKIEIWGLNVEESPSRLFVFELPIGGKN